jgi:ABC-type transport system involved in multi-copper enzyme maturation permease subunit
MLLVARKECLSNLLSLRFLVGLIVSAVMMGTVGYVLVEDYAVRLRNYDADVARHARALASTKVYSEVGVVADLPPSPLSVFSRPAQDLPTSITVSPYHVPSLLDEGRSSGSIDLTGGSTLPVNPLLKVFQSIDLAFVVGTLLSLLALLMVFDGFCGEREQGTLKLLLSCPAGRAPLLLGKFAGALAALAIPLTVGFLEVMLLWLLSPSVTLHAAEWAGVALIYGASVLFLSGFLLLGLCVSMLVRDSSASLMALLLVWVVVTMVLPSGLDYLAHAAHPVSHETPPLADLDRRFWETHNRVPYVQSGSWNVASTNPMGGEALLSISRGEAANRARYNAIVTPLKFAYAEDRYRILEEHANRLRAWRSMRDNLTRPSPSVLYQNFTAAIAATDLESYHAALRSARAYREALMAFLIPKASTPEWFTRVLDHPELEASPANEQYWNDLATREGSDALFRKVWTWDRVRPLDLREMPTAAILLPPLGARFVSASNDLALLLLMVAGLAAAALVLVQRYAIT